MECDLEERGFLVRVVLFFILCIPHQIIAEKVQIVFTAIYIYIYIYRFSDSSEKYVIIIIIIIFN